ncbi:hypothetical protein AK812_SmicGene38874 [Symbiodinium microadriaticum]|uniref:Uncharacterized protein n=1 Tax=Symbiodinium microadriaticum TaxID=2951 RepID=A0A1Q9CCM2_SYMMI|nr:hypothetical protein AK812_SmicGene38874 [Symbiodinium microadriaticum]
MQSLYSLSGTVHVANPIGQAECNFLSSRSDRSCEHGLCGFLSCGNCAATGLTLHLRGMQNADCVSRIDLEFVQSMLNRGIHRHVERYGCYANRDIAKLVKEAGLHIALDERAHFGTTYTLVCTKTPLSKEDGTE